MRKSVSKPEKPQRKVVREVRSPHGTRVMKSIVCTKCKKTDYISFVPKDGAPLLCTSCAEKELNVVGEVKHFSQDKYARCERCGKDYPAGPKRPPRAVHIDKDAELLIPKDTRPLCADCKVEVAAERRAVAKTARGGKPVVIKRKPKT
jgi:hypothetical protein